MGLWDTVKAEVKREFVARPDDAKDAVVWKWPDSNIRMFTQLTVEADEVCVFFRDGTVRGIVAPGRVTLDTSNIPFIGRLVDAATGGNMFISELFFVTTREMPNNKFGGPIGDMRDPDTKLAIKLMVFGDFSFKVVDAAKLVVGLAGLGKSDNASFVQWFKQQTLKVIRDTSAELVVKKKWPLLDVTSGAYTEEIEAETIQKVKVHMQDYGVDIVRLGNFTISMKEEDEERLKKFSERQALTGLAADPNYARAAASEPMFGLGAGLAQGGGQGGGGAAGTAMAGAGLGMGFGMAQQMMGQQGMYQQPPPYGAPQGYPQQPPPGYPPPQGQAPAAAAVAVTMMTCPSCKKPVPAAKFCPECGGKMEADKPKCPKCQGEVAPGVKFCPNCGNAMAAAAPAAPKCPTCGKEYPAGTKFCPDDGGKVA
ncbi:MAG: SPFH domain-containing protein [Deltaproteobacteria bacterium]|nr:SPFH domain-containing protein [Deltaproteobacteria bacterium]